MKLRIESPGKAIKVLLTASDNMITIIIMKITITRIAMIFIIKTINF